jgi:trimethylamine--corrinoid protein Co-methyltransferase
MTPAEAKAVELIHKNTLRILSEIGFCFHNEKANQILAENGIKVENGRAYFTEAQVMDAIEKANKDFVVYARNPKYDVRINTEEQHVTPGYGSAFVCELDGTLRNCVLDDYIKLARLVEQSDAIDFNGGIMAQPSDINAAISVPVMAYTLLKSTEKALLGFSANEETYEKVMDMLGIVFGGKDKLEEKPRMVSLISTLSPLAIDNNAVEALMVCCKYGQPVCVAPGPMAGGTGPISLAGNLSVANAEILAVNVLTQILRPNMPFIYGFAATISDMRNLDVSNACAGFNKISTYGALLAKYYGMPCRSGGGMSDAGGLTAQAGVESAMGLSQSFNSKANFIMHALGSLHSFNSVSFEKFMLDIETVGRLRYINSPLDCDEEALAFDAIKDVIDTGMQFMLHEHTLTRFRLDPWQWEVSLHGKSHGEPNAELYESIHKAMNAKLDAYKRPEMDPAVEKALDDYILALGMPKEAVEKL